MCNIECYKPAKQKPLMTDILPALMETQEETDANREPTLDSTRLSHESTEPKMQQTQLLYYLKGNRPVFTSAEPPFHQRAAIQRTMVPTELLKSAMVTEIRSGFDDPKWKPPKLPLKVAQCVSEFRPDPSQELLGVRPFLHCVTGEYFHVYYHLNGLCFARSVLPGQEENFGWIQEAHLTDDISSNFEWSSDEDTIISKLKKKSSSFSVSLRGKLSGNLRDNESPLPTQCSSPSPKGKASSESQKSADRLGDDTMLPNHSPLGESRPSAFGLTLRTKKSRRVLRTETI